MRKTSIMPDFSFFLLWHEGAIANILSLKAVKENYRVTYDSENGGLFHVHTNKVIIEFYFNPNGLHYTTINAIKAPMNKYNRCVTKLKQKYDGEVIFMVDTICREYEGKQNKTLSRLLQCGVCRQLLHILANQTLREWHIPTCL